MTASLILGFSGLLCVLVYAAVKLFLFHFNATVKPESVTMEWYRRERDDYKEKYDRATKLRHAVVAEREAYRKRLEAALADAEKYKVQAHSALTKEGHYMHMVQWAQEEQRRMKQLITTLEDACVRNQATIAALSQANAELLR